MSDRMVEILEAACRVMARQGASRLRMSDVAREATVSSALVHYYFATRADLVRRAFLHSDQCSDARLNAALSGETTASARLAAALREYLRDDPESRRNAVLWRELWSHAAFEPSLRDALTESYASWIDQLTELVSAVQADRSSSASCDSESVARRLAAIVDGLSAQILLGMLDAGEASALVEDAMACELALHPASS